MNIASFIGPVVYCKRTAAVHVAAHVAVRHFVEPIPSSGSPADTNATVLCDRYPYLNQLGCGDANEAEQRLLTMPLLTLHCRIRLTSVR
jgi:hypothetical protein